MGDDMELVSLFKRVIGLDVHQRQVTACAIIEQPDGQVIVEQRQFGAFQKDRRALAEWCAAFHPEEVVMESTGIYWKSTRCALQAKFQTLVVRRGRKRAIIALAHKLLPILFGMLSCGQPYRDSATDYEALFVKRNAPRRIKALRRYGFLPPTRPSPHLAFLRPFGTARRR
jgi:hypothetical protein